MRVKRLIQEHNTMFPARAGTQTTHSGVKGTNHGATTPPFVLLVVVENCDKINLLVNNSVYYIINILILILG